MAASKAKKRKESPAPPTQQQQQQQQQQESSPELPKRTKVQAQRKFAQGQSAPSSSSSAAHHHGVLLGGSAASGAGASAPGGGPSTSSGSSGTGGAAAVGGAAHSSGSAACGVGGDHRDAKPTELLPNKRPKTDEFLTFLCFRNTNLPPHLNFLNPSQPAGSNNTKESASSAATATTKSGKKTAMTKGAKKAKGAGFARGGKKGRPKGSSVKGHAGAVAKAKQATSSKPSASAGEPPGDEQATAVPQETPEAVSHPPAAPPPQEAENSTQQHAASSETAPAAPAAAETSPVIPFAVRKRAEVVPDGNRRSRAMKRQLRSTADAADKGTASPKTKQQRRSNRRGAQRRAEEEGDEDEDEAEDDDDENAEEDDEAADQRREESKKAASGGKQRRNNSDDEDEDEDEEEYFSAHDELDGGKETAGEEPVAAATKKSPVKGSATPKKPAGATKNATSWSKGKVAQNHTTTHTKRDADSIGQEEDLPKAAESIKKSSVGSLPSGLARREPKQESPKLSQPQSLAKNVEPSAKGKPPPVKRPRQKESPIFIPSTESGSGRMTRQRAFFEPVKVLPQPKPTAEPEESSKEKEPDHSGSKKKPGATKVAEKNEMPVAETPVKKAEEPSPTTTSSKKKGAAASEKTPLSTKAAPPGDTTATPTTSPRDSEELPKKAAAVFKGKSESAVAEETASKKVAATSSASVQHQNNESTTDVFEFSSDDEQPLAKSMNLKKGKGAVAKGSSSLAVGRGKVAAAKKLTPGQAKKTAAIESKLKAEEPEQRDKREPAVDILDGETQAAPKAAKGISAIRRAAKGAKRKPTDSEDELKPAEQRDGEDEAEKPAVPGKETPNVSSSARQSRKKVATGGKGALANGGGGDHEEILPPAPVRSQRPTRKTKEAAAIYMGIIGHKLQLADDEDDDLSLNSYPDLPNVKEMEKLESELKRNAAAAKESAGGEETSPGVAAATEKPAPSARRGRPPKQKVTAVVKGTTGPATTPAATKDATAAKSNGETAANKTTAGSYSTVELVEETNSNQQANHTTKGSAESKALSDDEDFLLNEEVNETKRKLEKSFSDSDDEPLAIKVSVKQPEKEACQVTAPLVATACPETKKETAASAPAFATTAAAASKAAPTVATASTQGSAATTSAPQSQASASAGPPHIAHVGMSHQLLGVHQQQPPHHQQPPMHGQHHHQPPQHLYHPIGSANTTPHPPSPFKTIEKKSPVPQSKILNVPATYAMPSTNPLAVPMPIMQMPMPMGMPMGPMAAMGAPPAMPHPGQGGQGPNFQKPAAYMPQGPPHYHGQHVQRPPPQACHQFAGPGGKVTGSSVGAPGSGPSGSPLMTPPGVPPQMQMSPGPMKYQQPPPPPKQYVPPMEAYPSPKINPNFLTPKFDRTTIPRPGGFPSSTPMRYEMSVQQASTSLPSSSVTAKMAPASLGGAGPTNPAGASTSTRPPIGANQMISCMPATQQLAAMQPPMTGSAAAGGSGVSPTAQLIQQHHVCGGGAPMTSHHMQHQAQCAASGVSGGGQVNAASGASPGSFMQTHDSQPAAANAVTGTASGNNNINNNNNDTGGGAAGGNDALTDEIGSILAATLMPSKEESGKIFGIASVSLAQSSGPDNTKCTLGKCGSIHKPVLGPVVPTESYIGDQLSGKERRKAKVNMTHEQIQKWLIECSSEPDEIHDDLVDDELDESLRPLLITPPPTRDDKESTSLSSSSRVTRAGDGAAKCEIAWTAKGPALKSSGPGAAAAASSSQKAAMAPADASSQPADSTVGDGGAADRITNASQLATINLTHQSGIDLEIISLVDNGTDGNRMTDEAPTARGRKGAAAAGGKQANSRATAANKASLTASSTPTGRQNKSLKSTPTLPGKADESSNQESNSQLKPKAGGSVAQGGKGGASSKRTPVYNQKTIASGGAATVELKESTTTSHKKSAAAVASQAYGGAFSADNEKSIYSFDKDDIADKSGAVVGAEGADPPETPKSKGIFRRQSRRDGYAAPEEASAASTPISARAAPVATKKRSATVPGDKVGAGKAEEQAAATSTLEQAKSTKQAKAGHGNEEKCVASTSKAAAANINSRSSVGKKKAVGNNKSAIAEEAMEVDKQDGGDSEDQTFFIPLNDSTSGGEGKDMQVIAVKCGKEGPDGPNQKMVVHTSLITKSEMVANMKPLPGSLKEELANATASSPTDETAKKKGAATTGKASAATAAASKATGGPAKLLPSPRQSAQTAAGGGGLIRVNSNSSLASPTKAKSAVAAGAGCGAAAAASAPKKFKDDKPPIKMANNTAFPRHDDPTQMVDAPIFRPTDKEFADPIEFIERITPIAARFGICKIIPPPTFKPECRISDEMRFTAQNQYVHKMLHRWGPSAKELSAIKKYLATQSIVMNHPPWIGGMEVDLPRLYHTVQEMGGLKEVIEKKKWARVAEDMSIPKLAQDRVTKLDDIYCKYLLPYDTLSPAERQKLFDEVEADWAKREARARRNADRFVNTESVSNEEDDMSSEDEEESEEEVDGVSMECIVKGRSMALSQFYRIARNTKALWFKNTDPTATEVEAEFWRHVAVRDSHVCVHAGSIDSSGWGYGFPSPGPKGKGSNYARHPWNLKVLTNNPGSVLRSLGPVMGVTVPTLHVGMLFSACCWYRDPHGLSWIEYLHTGASKLWYGIPDDQSANFRAALTALIPTHCQNKTIWLPCDTVMVPPHMLTDRGVSLCRIEQKPGEFIVVFPRAYTSSVSTGYVVSESVYFATNSWLELAKEDFRDIHDSSEPAMFSLEQLLFALGYDQRVTTETLIQMQPMLHDVYEKESAAREQLKAAGVTSAEKTISEKGARLKKQQPPFKSMESECELCSANLYISMVKTEDGNVYCLQHALKNLNKGNIQAKHCKLIYAYKVEDIENLMKTLKEKIQQKKNATTVGKKSK